MKILRYRLQEANVGDGAAGGGEGGDQSPPDTAEVERKASEMGWIPKDQWRGNPENWTDAQEFVNRGETFLPFLRKDRERLKAEREQDQRKLSTVEAELVKTRQQLEEFTSFKTEMAEERKTRRKAELGAEIRAAREAGDDVKVAELTNELGDVTKTVVTPAKTETATPPNNQPAMLPWVKTFIDTNDDFFKNPRKIALFNAIVVEKRQANDTRTGEVDGVKFLTEARDEVEKALGGNSRRQAASRTEESRSPNGGDGGSRGSGGKNYADLPAEAKSKCDAQEARFVGPDKAYKDQASWRRYYTSEYFA